MKKELLLIILVVTDLFAIGQTVHITSVVTIFEYGLPLPGVNLKV